jgi:hypothetical protein
MLEKEVWSGSCKIRDLIYNYYFSIYSSSVSSWAIGDAA